MNFTRIQIIFNHTITLLSVIIFSISFGQTSGKIRGKILNEENLALHGAQIFIKDLSLGAVSDADGNYIIMNVPPGDHDLQFNFIGYKPVIVGKVEVSVNRSTELNMMLEIQPILLDVVERKVYKHSRKKDQTGSIKNISEKMIDKLPASTVSEILETQAGIVHGHFRGGRNTDVSYMVDGIPTNNIFSGESQVIDLSPEIIKDIEVITGTFNAEYGKAMSGIVNMVTQSGRTGFAIGLKFYNSIYHSDNNNIFNGLSENYFSNFNRELQMNIKGPIIKNIVSGILNFRYLNRPGYLFGIERFLPADYSDFNHTGIAPENSTWNVNLAGETYYSEHNGTENYIPMEWLGSYNVFTKLSYHYSPRWRIDLTTTNELSKSQLYEHIYKYKPSGRAVRHTKSGFYAVKFSQMVSPNISHTLNLSSLSSWSGRYLYEDPLDSRYINNRYLSYAGGFISGGQDRIHEEQWLKNKTLKWNLFWQVNNNHALKTGVEFVQHTIENNPVELVYQNDNDPDLFSFNYDSLSDQFIFGNVELEYLPDSLKTEDDYKKYPVEFSAFLQDKMEFDEMTINGGIRFDYFDPRTVYPNQMRNPGNQLNYYQYYENGDVILDEFGNGLLDSIRMSTYLEADSKFQISPRFGLSYSMRNTAVIHFSYGHFFQIPSFYALYQNYRFFIPVQDYQTILGNPKLNAEKTVQYEFGYWQRVTPQFDMEITIYYRDIYDLLSAEVLTTYNNIKFGHFINKDYGNAKGMELSLHYGGSNFDVNANYTLQYTRGNADSPTTSFQRISDGMEPLPKLIPLSWDQRHTFNLILNWQLDKFDASIVGQYNSGLPFTLEPISESPLSNQFIYPNNAVAPSSFKVNTKLRYEKSIGKQNIRISLVVNNLLDALIEKRVYPSTGRASSVHIPESLINSFHSNYNDIYDMFNDPSMYDAPREIKVGVEWRL